MYDKPIANIILNEETLSNPIKIKSKIELPTTQLLPCNTIL